MYPVLHWGYFTGSRLVSPLTGLGNKKQLWSEIFGPNVRSTYQGDFPLVYYLGVVMFEKILVWLIICLSAFFIGRKFYRQWQRSTGGEGIPACNCDCAGCGESNCDERN